MQMKYIYAYLLHTVYLFHTFDLDEPNLIKSKYHTLMHIPKFISIKVII